MPRSAVALLGTATVLAGVDLVHKASTAADSFHARSPSYVVLVLGLTTLWTGAILATRSLLMALAGGVVCGGALGNLVSLALWSGVPNPILVEPIAFNLADVFVLGGFVLVACAALGFALTNRERLREPVRVR